MAGIFLDRIEKITRISDPFFYSPRLNKDFKSGNFYFIRVQSVFNQWLIFPSKIL